MDEAPADEMHTCYYPGGYLPDAPAHNKAVEVDVTARTVTRWDADGNEVESRPATEDELDARKFVFGVRPDGQVDIAGGVDRHALSFDFG